MYYVISRKEEGYSIEKEEWWRRYVYTRRRRRERESLLGGVRGLIARLNAAKTHWSVATPPEVEEEENGKKFEKRKSVLYDLVT